MNARRRSTSRKKRPIDLIVIHSIPQPDFLAVREQHPEMITPHYYIDAQGQTTQLADEQDIAHHSGNAAWNKHSRNIDKISIGIGIEHTPGTPLSDEQIIALHTCIVAALKTHKLQRDAIYGWDATDLYRSNARGTLVSDTRPFLSRESPLFDRDSLAGQLEALRHGPDLIPEDERERVFATNAPGGALSLDAMTGAAPPAATAKAALVLSPQQKLWLFLQGETYARRGGRLMPGWSFHQYATERRLGAPLAPSLPGSQALPFGGKSYGVQPFARDAIFNEIKPVERWDKIQSLNGELGRELPGAGLGRAILNKIYMMAGFPLVDFYESHKFAVKNELGPALGKNYPLYIGPDKYGIQVFAGDTLYSLEKEAWNNVYRLSTTPRGTPLHAVLWQETYKTCGAPYDPGSAFQSYAETRSPAEWLGTPLTGAYEAFSEGQTYKVQIFAYDTLYALPGQPPRRMSDLPSVDLSKITDHGGDENDAVSAKRPVFSILPVPMNSKPRLSQFFGYTKTAHNDRYRNAPNYTATYGHHSGLDIGVPTGTPMLAVAYGLVVGVGNIGSAGYPFGGCPPGGIIVRYGSVYAIYGHYKQSFVAIGQRVAPGDVIGETGYPAEPHLHFELRPVRAKLYNTDFGQRVDGNDNSARAVNPLDYFSPELRAGFFDQAYRNQGGKSQFCCGDINTQAEVQMGTGRIDQRSCEN